jgi:hypothetical protein
MVVTLMTRKPITVLVEEDIRAFPVWEFAADEEADEEQDETFVRPVDARAVPIDAYSLSVAARFTTPLGRELVGIIGLSTADGIEVGHAALIADGKYIFVPSPEFPGATKEYSRIASLLGMAVTDAFPLRFVSLVPFEGTGAPIDGMLAAQ